MDTPISRRQLLKETSLAAGAAVVLNQPATAEAAAETPRPGGAFRYCLNMSTIRGQGLSVPQQVELAARAGYDGIEPWLPELSKFVEAGGSPEDLGKRIADLGLTVDSAIGFAQWIVDDDAQRAAGLEQARRDMDLVRRIGGSRIAAPPVGAHQQGVADFNQIPARYRALLELGDKLGVVPQLEVWGFSVLLHRLGEAAHVALDAAHPRACLLLDVYHLYKGGNDVESVALLNAAAMHCFHVNDYPADPPREKIADADRVYPGDGVAPLGRLFRILHENGFRGSLSLELFNREYWKQDALHVARTGLEKTRAAVAAALGQ